MIAPKQPQPSNLCSNTYKSLPGDQDVFPLVFLQGKIPYKACYIDS